MLLAARVTVNATKEVISSAGSINSPQLLMLSGIGDPAQLSKLGIKTLVNNTQVGQNLQVRVCVQQSEAKLNI